MAIFGNFKQISLDDLIPLLKSQRGSLEIFNLDHLPRVTLYVESGRLVCLLLAGKPVDEVRVGSIIGELLKTKRGSFEFIPGVSPPQRHPTGWDLDSLLLQVTTIADEIGVFKGKLPDPDTVFQLISKSAPEDRRVAEFWRQSRKMLIAGASSRQLSRRLKVPLNHAGYYLLKLQQAGLVEPVHEEGVAKRLSLAGRVIGVLKRRL